MKTITDHEPPTRTTMRTLVHHVQYDMLSIARCGLSFSPLDLHAVPQVVTCLWCVAGKTR